VTKLRNWFCVVVVVALVAVALGADETRKPKGAFSGLSLILSERQPGFPFQRLRDRTFFFVLAENLPRIRSSDGLTGNSSTELNRPSSHSLTCISATSRHISNASADFGGVSRWKAASVSITCALAFSSPASWIAIVAFATNHSHKSVHSLEPKSCMRSSASGGSSLFDSHYIGFGLPDGPEKLMVSAKGRFNATVLTNPASLPRPLKDTVCKRLMRARPPQWVGP
jgi:hypothetical protein